jgi:hypothetical protein
MIVQIFIVARFLESDFVYTSIYFWQTLFPDAEFTKLRAKRVFASR